jgi:zinc transport system substrate-binding protein
LKKIALLFICLFSSCSLLEKKTVQNRSNLLSKPLVIVSAAPYIEIVEQIAGDKVFVSSIIPPDVDPHNFEPSPKDMGPLMHTALWIQVGEGFEPLLEKRLKETTPSIKILDLKKNTNTLESACKCNKSHNHADKSVDTHYWLDPLTVAHQAKVITNFLKEISPENQRLFDENLKKLDQTLINLNKDLTKKLAPYKGQGFLTTHNAYGYFCNRYHLLQFGIESPDGKETRTKDIHHLLEKANLDKKILICILTQPQHVNRAAEIIGEKLNLPLEMINPYEQNYINTINKLAKAVITYGKK